VPDKGLSKYAYINKTGKLVMKSQFDDAHPFSEGLAKVEVNGKNERIYRAAIDIFIRLPNNGLTK